MLVLYAACLVFDFFIGLPFPCHHARQNVPGSRQTPQTFIFAFSIFGLTGCRQQRHHAHRLFSPRFSRLPAPRRVRCARVCRPIDAAASIIFFTLLRQRRSLMPPAATPPFRFSPPRCCRQLSLFFFRHSAMLSLCDAAMPPGFHGFRRFRRAFSLFRYASAAYFRLPLFRFLHAADIFAFA